MTYLARRSGWEPRKAALEGNPCTWLNDHLAPAVTRLDAQFLPGEQIAFETELGPYRFYVDYWLFILSAYADAIAQTPTGANLREFKFVSLLTAAALIQVVTNAFLWAKKTKRLLPRIIYNLRDGQKFAINATMEGIERLVFSVLRAKVRPREISDAEFLERCGAIQSKIYNSV